MLLARGEVAIGVEGVGVKVLHQRIERDHILKGEYWTRVVPGTVRWEEGILVQDQLDTHRLAEGAQNLCARDAVGLAECIHIRPWKGNNHTCDSNLGFSKALMKAEKASHLQFKINVIIFLNFFV